MSEMNASLYSIDNGSQLFANFGGISFNAGFSTACIEAKGSMAVQYMNIKANINVD
jgi:hypothetical protein